MRGGLTGIPWSFVKAEDVRKLVAQLPGTEEGIHHGHPDFRVNKKIFATLSESEDRAALRLTQLEAREVVSSNPHTVRLVSDREPFSWISVLIADFDAQHFEDLLEEAWKLRAPEDLEKRHVVGG
jgi:hypothetical protein